jgi:acetyl esterase/lipase
MAAVARAGRLGRASQRRLASLACACFSLVGAAVISPTPALAAPDPLAPVKGGCELRRSADPAPAPVVVYRTCSGRVASFDGTPLDVTVTLPAPLPHHHSLPLVVFLHGFINSKREYLSATREGTGSDRGGEAYKTVEWNNVWFASRGYAVLNYSARGNGDSGGQVGLASKDIEVRDTHYLTGLLADDASSSAPLVGIDPRRVAVIGGSYGGGQAWLLLTTRESPSLHYGTWFSPGGRLLRLAAVVPGFTWSDLLYTLAPNGRQRSDGVDPASADTPFGIGKQTVVDGLLATTPAQTLPAYVAAWVARLNAGEPYDNPADPVIPEAKRALSQDRSAFFQDGYFEALAAHRQEPVPVLAAEGWTDPIFPAIESVRMYQRLRASSPGYPIQLYFGDFEHLTALVRIADFRYWHVLGNRLLDHYLRGVGARPDFDVQTAISNCDPGRFGPIVRASDWNALHPHAITFHLSGSRQTVSPNPDPRGRTLDPVVVSQQRGRGCLTTTLPPTPGVATYTVPVIRAFTLIGMPRLTMRYQTLAPDIELNSRLWDLAPDGTQTLVSRGAYRAVGPNPAGDTADYELFGNAWRFAAGHQLMLEITQDDATYFRTDNFASTATISDAGLVMPVGAPSPTGTTQSSSQPSIRLSVRPARVRVGSRARFRFRATARLGGRQRAVRAATIRFAGRTARTNARGRAEIRTALATVGRYSARASKPGFRTGRAFVRARHRRRVRHAG